VPIIHLPTNLGEEPSINLKTSLISKSKFV
jgi:hypothetical protein